MRELGIMGVVAGFALALAGCGDDDGPGGQPDAAPEADAPPSPPDAGGGPPDASVGDNNDSFEQAQNVPVGDQNGALGAIQTPGDHDFFKFMGTAGQWLSITTSANPMDDLDAVDTVITLYDASMNRIAEDDDAVPRVNTDSEIIIKLPSTGTFYVEVQEYSDWAGDPPEGRSDYIYRLIVLPLDPATLPAVGQETEPNDDVMTASPSKLVNQMGSTFGIMLGGFASASDVDVVKFTVPAGARRFTSFSTVPWGNLGYGSTASIGRVWVTDATGAVTIARLAPSMSAGPWDMNPPLMGGDYYLWIERPMGASAGTNDFWVLKHFTGTQDNPAETEGDTVGGMNDTLAQAQALTQQTQPGFKVAYILAWLPVGDLADYFSFSVAAGEKVSVYCGSQSAGSGIMGLKAEVVNASDVTLAQETESATQGIAIRDVSVGGAGTYYVKLTKAGQDAAVTGNWIRCGVVTAP